MKPLNHTYRLLLIITLFAANIIYGGPFSPPAGQQDSKAISMDDRRLVSWAKEITTVTYGENVDEEWRTPEKALGPATGDVFDVVSLGEGGQITVAFDPPLHDGPGDDLAVFENSFSSTFLELAFVEVSSDGTHFVRFPSTSLTAAAVGGNGSIDATEIDGLAGKYRAGYGTGFDLAQLRELQETTGLNNDHISHVRIVDIVGDGREKDSSGRSIFDPYPTNISAGFDLDAVGAMDGFTSWFSDIYPIAQGWYWAPWSGFVFGNAFPWAYLNDHGWVYCTGDGTIQWLWDPTEGWLYGSSDARPFFYSVDKRGWISWPN